MAIIKDGIIYRKSPSLNHPNCNYPGFKPCTTVLKAGTVYKTDHKPLACDIIYDRDVAIRMRDGITLYADVYRPVTEEKIPVIMAVTCFGKNKTIDGATFVKGGSHEAMGTYVFPGVPKAWTSGLEPFEGPDPGFWVPHEYAICLVDIRGAYSSEGLSPYLGAQEAQDDYDCIEWLAAQEWCNGKVSMAGNSWLAIDQYFAAATQPPHLVCIAPWEGWNDMYRDEYMVGGIATLDGFRWNNVYKDGGYMEDAVANCLAHPLYDEYWEGKRADVSKINIPMYIVASYNDFHTPGAFRAWRESPSNDKWLRIHTTMEWNDAYKEEHELELLQFFDYFVKEKKDNGWDKVPKCRVSVLDLGHDNEHITERVEEDFPIPRQEITEMYLDARDMSISYEAPEEEASCEYVNWDGKSMVTFKYTFKEEVEMIGFINVKLWVESFGYDDMDIFVQLAKRDVWGFPTEYYYTPGCKTWVFSGPNTRQRVSLRKLDPDRSTINEPYHTYDTIEKLKPHEIVPIECGLLPTGIKFRKGETMEIKIAGYNFLPYEPISFENTDVRNNGKTIIHTGGQYDSKVIIPFVPASEQKKSNNI